MDFKHCSLNRWLALVLSLSLSLWLSLWLSLSHLLSAERQSIEQLLLAYGTIASRYS